MCAHRILSVKCTFRSVCLWMKVNEQPLSLNVYCIPQQRQVLTGYRPHLCLTTRLWEDIIWHISPCASVWIWHVRLLISSVFDMNRDVLAWWVWELGDDDDDDDGGMMMRTNGGSFVHFWQQDWAKLVEFVLLRLKVLPEKLSHTFWPFIFASSKR